jgi:predicted phage tail protein
MKTIRLYGDMGRRFGREFQLDVKSPAEAVRALCVVVSGFEAYLHEHAKEYYKVFVGARNACDELPNPCSDREIIRIAPVISGAGSAGKIILGAILIVAAFATGQWELAGVAKSLLATTLFGLGVSLVIGGVIELLTPVPKLDGNGDNADNQANSNFNGPVNTTAQGNPVPLAYGTVLAGSAVISAGIPAEYKPLES